MWSDQSESMWVTRKAVIRAGIVACLYALILYLSIYVKSAFLYFIVGLLVTPFCICALYLSLADPHGHWPQRRAFGHCFWLMLLVLLGTVLLFNEGTVCVVMAAPLFLFMGFVAVPVTRGFATWDKARRLPLFMLILPFISMPVERQADYPTRIEHVRTVVDIQAPPALVWNHTVEIRNITPSERIPSFSHSLVGLPGPLEARMGGSGVGAVRYLRWQEGVHFQEVVTQWQPGHLLSWEFRFQPDSIPRHIESHVRVDADYLRILNGRYELSRLPNGGTRVTLVSSYEMATPFNDYCAWWGQIFLTDFHEAVLHIIKGRAEKAALVTMMTAPN